MRKLSKRLRDFWRGLAFQQKVITVGLTFLVVGLIYWFWPTRVDEVVRFDGGGKWERDSAPCCPRCSAVLLGQPVQTKALAAIPGLRSAIRSRLGLA